MPKVAVYDMRGTQVGEIDLNDRVFGIEPNEAVMQQFVKMQLANKRQGTASTKTRAEVRGGGRNPGSKKEQDEPGWAAAAILYGAVAESFLAQNPETILIHFPAR